MTVNLFEIANILHITQEDELKYSFKRLVDGLAATREAARPGFSLALAQVCISKLIMVYVLSAIYLNPTFYF